LPKNSSSLDDEPELVTVFRPARLSPEQLERGYWRAYRDFYRWGSILRGASTKPTLRGALRHAAYAAGWKKFEPLWDPLIRLKRAGDALPLLERVLDEGPDVQDFV
jgi:hypothetical protein